jgi:hypothetical protein
MIVLMKDWSRFWVSEARDKIDAIAARTNVLPRDQPDKVTAAGR